MNATQEVAAHKRARKAGVASFIGTTIEWYDFYAYGIAAALVFGKIFFPADGLSRARRMFRRTTHI